MFTELEKYTCQGHFFLNRLDDLNQVCNAPANQGGVYTVYALENGRIELVLIDSTGKIKLNDTSADPEKGSLKDRIVNGRHFTKIPRRIAWPNALILENIQALDIYWFVTYDSSHKDNPKKIETILLKNYYEIYGQMPRWNKKF